MLNFVTSEEIIKNMSQLEIESFNFIDSDWDFIQIKNLFVEDWYESGFKNKEEILIDLI